MRLGHVWPRVRPIRQESRSEDFQYTLKSSALTLEPVLPGCRLAFEKERCSSQLSSQPAWRALSPSPAETLVTPFWGAMIPAGKEKGGDLYSPVLLSHWALTRVLGSSFKASPASGRFLRCSCSSLSQALTQNGIPMKLNQLSH